MFARVFPKPNSITNLIKLSTAMIAISISMFHLYTGAFGIIEAYGMRTIHLLTLMTLGFLMWPTSKNWSTSKSACVDIPLALICLFIDFYLILNHDRIVSREWYTGVMTPLDVVLGWLTIILLVEVTRRVAGLALPIVAVIFMVYTIVGNYMPYPFTVRSPSLKIFIDHLFLTPHAIFGVPLGVSATFVFLFILFAALLEETGAGKFIIDFSYSAVGWATGGTAKVSVIASALFGTISGHSVANVYGTGTFTIPLMKKNGYRPEYAGAVEAAASAGGQLMPPIMGAAAFIMAEVMGVSYLSICKAALLPALLYFVAVFASTHLEALKMGIARVPRSSLPPMKDTIYKGYHFIVPIFLLIFVLVKGFTPFRAAFIAIVALVIVAMLRKSSRINLFQFFQALISGSKSAVVIASCCACAGIVVGCLDITGIGLKFVDIIMLLSNGILPVMLVLVMFACLVLGMGVPTAPAYIIVSMIAAPSLVEFGILPISAHMFVFYSCLLSAITPPVALAAYAGAAIAEADVMKTACIAAILGFVKYIIPFVFVYNPALLMEGSTSFIIFSFVTALLGTIFMSAALSGYIFVKLNFPARTLLFLGSISLLVSEVFTDVAGIIIVVMVAVFNYLESRRQPEVQITI